MIQQDEFRVPGQQMRSAKRAQLITIRIARLAQRLSWEAGLDLVNTRTDQPAPPGSQSAGLQVPSALADDGPALWRMRRADRLGRLGPREQAARLEAALSTRRIELWDAPNAGSPVALTMPFCLTPTIMPDCCPVETCEAAILPELSQHSTIGIPMTGPTRAPAPLETVVTPEVATSWPEPFGPAWSPEVVPSVGNARQGSAQIDVLKLRESPDFAPAATLDARLMDMARQGHFFPWGGSIYSASPAQLLSAKEVAPQLDMSGHPFATHVAHGTLTLSAGMRVDLGVKIADESNWEPFATPVAKPPASWGIDPYDTSEVNRDVETSFAYGALSTAWFSHAVLALGDSGQGSTVSRQSLSEKSVSPDHSRHDAERPSSSDLAALPGAGPGLIWMLQKCGISSLRDMALADTAMLAPQLGPVARIVDLQAWQRIARHHMRQSA